MDSSYDGLIAQHAQRVGLDPLLLKELIRQESQGNPNAVSPKGALGVGQIMPKTAVDPGYGVPPLDPAKRTDPEESIRFAADYLSTMVNKFGDESLGVMAYNGGPGYIEDWRAKGADRSTLYAETRNYEQKIMGKTSAARASTAPRDTSLMDSRPPAAPVKTNIPESWLEKRGDDVEMLVKDLGIGLLETGALIARVADGPLEWTSSFADAMQAQADKLDASLPQWIRDDIHKQVFTRTEDGGWEFDMPSLRAIASLAVRSVGPGGVIGMGGKGLAVAGAKLVPKLFQKGARSGAAFAYGGANSAYIAADSYHNVYQRAYDEAIAAGKTEDEATAEAEGMAQVAALSAGTLALGTGAVGGLALTAGGVLKRIGHGAALGSATEAIEEPGQYVAEQLASGQAVDPMEVASRAVLGALAAGPMEGVMAGLSGKDPETGVPAPIDPTAAAGGEALVDEILGDVPVDVPLVGPSASAPDGRPDLPEALPALPGEPAPPPPLMGMPEQTTTTEGAQAGQPMDVPFPDPNVPRDLEFPEGDQATGPVTAEPNVYMDEAGNIWDQDGNPAERPAPAPEPAAVDPVSDIELEVEKLTGRALRKELKDAGEKGYSKDSVLRLKAKVTALREKAAATPEPVVEPVVELEPTVEAAAPTEAQRKGWRDAHRNAFASKVSEKARQRHVRKAQEMTEARGEPMVLWQRAGSGLMQLRAMSAGIPKGTDWTAIAEYHPEEQVAPVVEPVVEAPKVKKLTKKQQAKADRLESIAAAAQATADAKLEAEGTPGLMVNEDEEFDPAAAMAAATAKLNATTEATPEQTPEQLDAAMNEEARTAASEVKGMKLNAEMKRRKLSRSGTVAEKQERLAMDMKREKMALAAAPLDPNAGPLETATETAAKKKIKAGQADFDRGLAAIMHPEAKVADLRAIAKTLGLLGRKDEKTGKVIALPKKKEALRAAVLAEYNKRFKRPADYVAPVATAPAEAAPTAEPAPEAAPGQPAVSEINPPPEVEPVVPTHDVVFDAKGEVKPKTLVSSRKRAVTEALAKWGPAWKKNVHRIVVGNRVFTMFKPQTMKLANATPIELQAAKMGGAGHYVFWEGEVGSFNPETDQHNWKPTGTLNAELGYAFIKDMAQKDQQAAERAAVVAKRQMGPQPVSDDLLTAQAHETSLKALAMDVHSDEFLEAAAHIWDLHNAAATNSAREAIKRAWWSLSTEYDSRLIAPGAPTMAQVVTNYRESIRKATALGTAASKANEQGLIADANREAAEKEENDRLSNEWEKATLEYEKARGLSMAAAGYWLRHKFRNLRQGTEKSPEDIKYKSDNPIQAALLEQATLGEVLDRALRSQKIKWITRLQDSRVSLKERQLLLQKVIAEHNAGLDPNIPAEADQMWDWSDELDAYALYDQQDAKVGALIDTITNETEPALAKAIEEAGVSERELNDYMVSVHVLARNAKLRREQFLSRERRGGTESINVHPSGVTDKQANEALDRLAPGRDPARLAVFEKLFVEHIMPMIEEQRQTYRRHKLVPEAILSRWEPGTRPADLYTMPAENDLKYAEKLDRLFRYTYVPLQHTPVDYNKDMTIANLRKTDLAGVGEVWGDEVKAALNSPVKEALPQHVYAQIKANMIKGYVRGAHNDTLNAVARLAERFPNRYLWRVVRPGDEFGLTQVERDPLTGDPMEQGFVEPKTTPGFNLRRDSGVTAFRDEEMTSLRFKDKDGKPAVIQVHDTFLATALAPEPSINNWPIRNLGAISRWVSSINTTYSPGFMIVNPIRDLLSAKVQLAEKGMEQVASNLTVAGYKTMIRAYWQELRGTPRDGTNDAARDLIDKYRAAGGHTQFYRPETIADHVRSLAQAVADVRQDGGEHNIKTMLGHIPKVMRDANTALENVARLLAFEGALKAKRPDGSAQFTAQQAATISKNLVVNFGRRGTWGPTLNALYPFYNASVQGNAILYQTWKRSPKIRKATAALAGVGLANGILQEMMSGEDDDGRSRYANLSDHVKERNLVIWIPGTKDYVKVPLPYGLNVPVVIGDALASVFVGGDPPDAPHQFMRMINAAKGTFNPIASSTALRTIAPLVAEPAVDMLTNRNFFNSPINPDRSKYEVGQRTDAFNVADPDDSRWSTVIAQQLAYMTGGNPYRKGLIDVAPGTLRYMWDTVLGSAGSTARRTVEALTADTLHQAGVKVPVIRRFYGTENDFHHKERYYEMREDLAQLKKERDYFYAGKRADPDAWMDFQREHGDYWDRGVMRKFDQTEKMMRKFTRRRNEVRKIADKTSGQRDRIAFWDKKIDDAVISFNRFYYEKFITGDM